MVFFVSDSTVKRVNYGKINQVVLSLKIRKVTNWFYANYGKYNS
jgi:hypothetical protein